MARRQLSPLAPPVFPGFRRFPALISICTHLLYPTAFHRGLKVESTRAPTGKSGTHKNPHIHGNYLFPAGIPTGNHGFHRASGVSRGNPHGHLRSAAVAHGSPQFPPGIPTGTHGFRGNLHGHPRSSAVAHGLPQFPSGVTTLAPMVFRGDYRGTTVFRCTRQSSAVSLPWTAIGPVEIPAEDR